MGATMAVEETLPSTITNSNTQDKISEALRWLRYYIASASERKSSVTMMLACHWKHGDQETFRVQTNGKPDKAAPGAKRGSKPDSLEPAIEEMKVMAGEWFKDRAFGFLSIQLVIIDGLIRDCWFSSDRHFGPTGKKVEYPTIEAS